MTEPRDPARDLAAEVDELREQIAEMTRKYNYFCGMWNPMVQRQHDFDRTVTRQWEDIKSIRAQFAALESRRPADADPVESDICEFCNGRGWSINKPSGSMYPCSRCDGQGRLLRDPADADPVCADPSAKCANPECGHTAAYHDQRKGECWFGKSVNPVDCDCQHFVAPAPERPATLDVEVDAHIEKIMRAVWRYGEARYEYLTCNEIPERLALFEERYKQKFAHIRTLLIAARPVEGEGE